MLPKFIHYLRNERRATGLTQADIASLLGASWKSKVSRYERRQAIPPLETALGYEAVFGKPIAKLFGRQFSVTPGEDFAEIRSQTLIHPQQISLHGFLVIGSREIGWTPVLSIPGMYEFVRQQARAQKTRIWVDKGALP